MISAVSLKQSWRLWVKSSHKWNFQQGDQILAKFPCKSYVVSFEKIHTSLSQATTNLDMPSPAYCKITQRPWQKLSWIETAVKVFHELCVSLSAIYTSEMWMWHFGCQVKCQEIKTQLSIVVKVSLYKISNSLTGRWCWIHSVQCYGRRSRWWKQRSYKKW